MCLRRWVFGLLLMLAASVHAQQTHAPCFVSWPGFNGYWSTCGPVEQWSQRRWEYGQIAAPGMTLPPSGNMPLGFNSEAEALNALMAANPEYFVCGPLRRISGNERGYINHTASWAPANYRSIGNPNYDFFPSLAPQARVNEVGSVHYEWEYPNSSAPRCPGGVATGNLIPYRGAACQQGWYIGWERPDYMDPGLYIRSEILDRTDACHRPLHDDPKALGRCPSPFSMAGNPINVANGNKYQEEVDYIASGSSPLEFRRSYNSGAFYIGNIGKGWRHSYDRSVASFGTFAVVYRPDGRALTFRDTGTVNWSGDPDVNDRLQRRLDAGGTPIGWRVTTESDAVEVYNASGQLQSITERNGRAVTFTYSDATTPSSIAPKPGILIAATDQYGRLLAFAYNASGHMTTMTAPGGRVFGYGYDAVMRLTSVTYPDQTTRRYVYDEPTLNGGTSEPFLLTGLVDENNVRYATFAYDSTGRAIRSEHAGGANRTSLNFGADGVSTTVTDARGSSRTLRLTKVAGLKRPYEASAPCPSCGGGMPLSVTYDANANVVDKYSFAARRTLSVYDLTRNLETSRTEGAGTSTQRTTTTTWHATFRLPLVVSEDVEGGTRVTTNTYDAQGNLLQRTTSGPRNDGTGGTVSRTWQWTYDAIGQPLTMTDPNNRTTTHAYYAANDPSPGKRGNLATVANALGHATTYTDYDDDGRALRIVDPNGVVTTLTYDSRGRLRTSAVGGELTTYGYDNAGQLTSITNPDGHQLTMIYDAARRLTELRDELDNRITYTLDATGNRIKEETRDATSRLVRLKQREFDALNRIGAEIGAANQRMTYTYDPDGDVATITDPLLRSTGFVYDALRQLKEVLDPDAKVTRYSYDKAGNVSQVLDPRGLPTTYAHDALGNRVRETSTATGESRSTFDNAGNVLTKDDARGVRASYVYDAINRLVRITYSKTGTPDEAHTYDFDGTGTGQSNVRGRLTRFQDASATTTLSYSAQGRVTGKTQVTGAVTLTMSASYASNGTLASYVTPSGQQVAMTYLGGRTRGVTVNGLPVIVNATHEPFGSVGALQWANNLFAFRDFDQDGRLAEWELRNGASVLRNVLTYDESNQIRAIADAVTPSRTTTYDYDRLGRLVRSQRSAPADIRQFSYDAVGNRLTSDINGSAVTSTVSATSNQITTVAGAVPTDYMLGGVDVTYTYNNANRLVEVRKDGAVVASYGYNALGQRVRKQAAGVTTYFYYDERGRLLGEYDATGRLVQETIWLEDLPIAVLKPRAGATGQPIPVDIFHVHADHLGTPRTITRPVDNALVWRWDNLDPFGSNAPDENPAGQGVFPYHLRFPGQYYDAETGTHYNYFRDYDPTVGRYAQSDPIGLEGGLNTYVYVADPLTQIDPTGEMGRAPPPGKPAPGPIRRPGHPNAGCGPNGRLLEYAIPDYPIYSFRSCCDSHDDCYADCKNKPSKESCDDKFCDCLRKKCRVRGGAVAGDCLWLANAYCNGVKGSMGQGAFNDSRKDCKDC